MDTLIASQSTTESSQYMPTAPLVSPAPTSKEASTVPSMRTVVCVPIRSTVAVRATPSLVRGLVPSAMKRWPPGNSGSRRPTSHPLGFRAR